MEGREDAGGGEEETREGVVTVMGKPTKLEYLRMLPSRCHLVANLDSSGFSLMTI